MELKNRIVYNRNEVTVVCKEEYTLKKISNCQSLFELKLLIHLKTRGPWATSLT